MDQAPDHAQATIPFPLGEAGPGGGRPRFYQVHRGDRHYGSGKVTVLPFIEFCRELEMP
jgi:hypothetical protein